MTHNNLCLNCFKVKGDYEVCPHCGFIESLEQEQAYHLYYGVVLQKRYIIGTVIGFGGFGVTYKAWDSTFNTVVAIKEFYPMGFVNRVPGEKQVVVFSGDKQRNFSEMLQRFLEEAKNMAKFNSQPNIVNVLSFFLENNTAYIVMEYLDGVSLKNVLENNNGKLDIKMSLDILKPLMDGLSVIHSQNIIHRDISPDNIIITTDNRVKILDFGAARFSTGENEKTMEVIVKPGYTAPEQYRSKSKQGPWTDIYGLGATFYHMITGEKPDESVDRQIDDQLKKPSELGIVIDKNIEKSIMKSLAIKADVRFQKMSQFKDAVFNNLIVDYPEVELKKRKTRRIIVTSVITTFSILLVMYAVLISTLLKPEERLSAQDINDAAISLWFPMDNSQEELNLFNEIKNQFENENSHLSVELVGIDSEKYVEELSQAFNDKNTPTLFYSTDIDDELLKNTVSLKLLEASLNKDDYSFLSKYSNYYPMKRKMPVGFKAKVAYVNTALARENNIVVPEMISSSQELNEISQNNSSSNDFIEAFKNDQLLYLIEYTDLLRDIQNSLQGYYGIIPIVIDGSIPTEFTDEWSVSSYSNVDQQKTAMLFISYVLSQHFQNKFYIQNDGGAIPLNNHSFNDYLDINYELNFLRNY